MKMTKLIYLFAVPLLVASCISEEAPITDASDHFFKVSTANPDIQQIVFLLKQKNDSVEFTSKFIKENQQEYVLAGRWKAISFFMK
jgi:hypothetical protein